MTPDSVGIEGLTEPNNHVNRLLLVKAFVAGAKWWEFTKTGGTMWQSDQHDAMKAAQEKYK